MNNKIKIFLPVLFFILVVLTVVFTFFTSENTKDKTPNSSDIFDDNISIVPIKKPITQKDIDSISIRLQNISNTENQITLKKIFPGAVAGYLVNNNQIILITQGDGIRYSINLDTLETSLFLSQVNVPKAHSAYIYEKDSYFISFFSGSDEELEHLHITQNETSLVSQADNFYSSLDGTVFYTTTSTNSTIGNIKTKDSETTISLPFIKKWVFKKSPTEEFFVFQPPTYFKENVIFQYKDNLTQYTEPFQSNNITPGVEFDLITKNLNHSVFSTTLKNKETGVERELGVFTLAEKCSLSPKFLICGIPNNFPQRTRGGDFPQIPDSWYMGDIVFNDSILLINKESLKVVTKLVPEESVDLINPIVYENRFYFINKTDGSLWMLTLGL